MKLAEAYISSTRNRCKTLLRYVDVRITRALIDLLRVSYPSAPENTDVHKRADVVRNGLPQRAALFRSTTEDMHPRTWPWTTIKWWPLLSSGRNQ